MDSQCQATVCLGRAAERNGLGYQRGKIQEESLHYEQAPKMLQRLQRAVIDSKNVFEVSMDAVHVCSLRQITNALFEVGGQYRQKM